MTELHLILDNVRSTYNVGSLLRSADGLGIAHVHTIGITPHMRSSVEDRLPHVIDRAEREIKKTALGAERLMNHHFADSTAAATFCRQNSINIYAIELTEDSTPLSEYSPAATSAAALVLGHEREGVSPELLAASNQTLHIPMNGQKDSLNVSIAGAIAMYELHSKFASI